MLKKRQSIETQHSDSKLDEPSNNPNHGYKTELLYPQPVKLLKAGTFFAPPMDPSIIETSDRKRPIEQLQALLHSDEGTKGVGAKFRAKIVPELRKQLHRACKRKPSESFLLPPSKRAKKSIDQNHEPGAQKGPSK